MCIARQAVVRSQRLIMDVGNPSLTGLGMRSSSLELHRACLRPPSLNVYAEHEKPQGRQYFCNPRRQHYVGKEMNADPRWNNAHEILTISVTEIRGAILFGPESGREV